MIFSHLSHQFSILSMHSCYSSDVLTVLQGLEELTVSQHEHVLIGHEHLKGVHSFLSHQLLHLSSHLQDEHFSTCKVFFAFFGYCVRQDSCFLLLALKTLYYNHIHLHILRS